MKFSNFAFWAVIVVMGIVTTFWLYVKLATIY